MTTVEQKAKKFTEEYKDELLVAGAVVAYIGALVLYSKGYKKGFETGREYGKKETFDCLFKALKSSTHM